MINKIFQSENKYYKFYIALPIFLGLEMLLGIILAPKSSDLIYICLFFSVLCILTSIILGLVYYGIHNKFLKQFHALTEEQKKSIMECGIARCFKTYLSKDILIQYGMFTKRIIWIDEIESIQRKKGTQIIRAGAYMTSEEVDEMHLIMKNGRGECVDTSDEMMEAITALRKGDLPEEFLKKNVCVYGEKPVEGMTALFLLGSVILFMGGYSRVMNQFVPTVDSISKMLFITGYENRFYMGAVLLMGIGFVSTFIWRFLVQRGKKHTAMMPVWISFALLSIMLVYTEYENNFQEDVQIARADYQLYQEGVCEQVVAKQLVITENPFFVWVNENVYNQLDDARIEVKYLKVEMDENLSSQEDARNEFILLNPECESWEEEKTYRIYYLKNARIVIKLEKME